MNDEFLEIERAGFDAGVNPMFGEWRRTFGFPAVPYSSKAEAKKEFRERLRAELKSQFVFTHQVTLTATLYLNHEKVLETPEYGDLDNCAKQLCDSVKGKGGLLIDDCQIQRIDISWIDVPKDSYFELELRGSPDDFASSDVSLYEMDDGLFYPVSSSVWELGKFVEMDVMNKHFQLRHLSTMTSVKRSLRHKVRQAGAPQFRAFQMGLRVSPLQWGFHRTRVAESGFRLVPRAEWEAEYEAWASAPESAEKAKLLSESLARYKQLLESFNDATAKAVKGA